jgi:hypothetical protein
MQVLSSVDVDQLQGKPLGGFPINMGPRINVTASKGKAVLDIKVITIGQWISELSWDEKPGSLSRDKRLD